MGFWDIGAGDLLSAGTSLIGGFMGKSSADKAAEMNAQIARENLAQQREFAQHGIRWRVDDAKAAGIHPLFAMGAQLPSYQPMSASFVPDNSMGDALSQAGQDIGRAIDATRTRPEKTNARLDALALERSSLQNDLLRAQIAKLTQTGPAMPTSSQRWLIDGQGDAENLIEVKPMERSAVQPGMPYMEPGAVSDLGFARTATGLAPVPSKDVKERIEDNFPAEAMWFWRNQGLANFGAAPPPPKGALPPGAIEWQWHYGSQEWRPIFKPNQRRPDTTVKRVPKSGTWRDWIPSIKFH